MGINDYIQVGSRIKEYRKMKGITQKEMAERLQLNVSTYSNYENNHREPNMDTIKEISKILNIPVWKIIGAESGINIVENEDGSTSIKASVTRHSERNELTEYLDELHKRPEMKMLFKTAKGATKADVEKAVKIIEMFKGSSHDDE